jgi:hypothetical protein
VVKNCLEYSCLVSGGKIPLEVSRAVAVALRHLDGKRVIVSLREHRARRSNPQNRYYWGVVVPLVLQMFVEAGNDTTAEEVHEYMKEHVGGLSRVLIGPDGKRRPVVRSSTTLDTSEWEDFMEKVRAWAAALGCQIPLPHEGLIHEGE